jgi:hypothetical protein
LLATAVAEIHSVCTSGAQVVVSEPLLDTGIAISDTLVVRRIVLPIIADVVGAAWPHQVQCADSGKFGALRLRPAREAAQRAASFAMSRSKFYWQRYIRPLSPFTTLPGVQPIPLRAA